MDFGELRMNSRSLLTLATLAAFSLTAGVATAAEPDDVINYRKQVMEAVGANTTALGLIVQGKVPHEDSFLAHAEMLAKASSLSKAAFRENTAGKGREKTTAKAEIWKDWAKFEKGLDTLEAQTAELVKLASEGGVKAAAPKLREIFGTCKSCHDDFRTK